MTYVEQEFSDFIDRHRMTDKSHVRLSKEVAMLFASEYALKHSRNMNRLTLEYLHSMLGKGYDDDTILKLISDLERATSNLHDKSEVSDNVL